MKPTLSEALREIALDMSDAPDQFIINAAADVLEAASGKAFVDPPTAECTRAPAQPAWTLDTCPPFTKPAPRGGGDEGLDGDAEVLWFAWRTRENWGDVARAARSLRAKGGVTEAWQATIDKSELDRLRDIEKSYMGFLVTENTTAIWTALGKERDEWKSHALDAERQFENARYAHMHEAADILQRFSLRSLQGPVQYQEYASQWMARAEAKIRDAAGQPREKALDSGASVVVDREEWDNLRSRPELQPTVDSLAAKLVKLDSDMAGARMRNDDLEAKLAEAERERDALAGNLTVEMRVSESARADAERLQDRLRTTCRALVNAAGADGPMSAEDAAARLVAKYEEAVADAVRSKEILEAERAEHLDEVTRFNRGHERARAGEPWSAIDDEFECMGWAWFQQPEHSKLIESMRADLATERGWLRESRLDAERLRILVGQIANDLGIEPDGDFDEAISKLRTLPATVSVTRIEEAAKRIEAYTDGLGMDEAITRDSVRESILEILRSCTATADVEELASAISIEVRMWPHDQAQLAARAALAYLGVDAKPAEPRAGFVPDFEKIGAAFLKGMGDWTDGARSAVTEYERQQAEWRKGGAA